MMILCERCGVKIENGTKLCPNCGMEIPIASKDSEQTIGSICSRCGSVLKENANFCDNCGFAASSNRKSQFFEVKKFKNQIWFNIISVIFLLIVLLEIVEYSVLDSETIKLALLISIIPSMNENHKSKNYCA
jgi:predicted amidophosphoribosyltransferase